MMGGMLDCGWDVVLDGEWDGGWDAGCWVGCWMVGGMLDGGRWVIAFPINVGFLQRTGSCLSIAKLWR